MVEHANIIASVGQPKLIENVARSVGNDNNGLHTEPFLGRASMLCFLYGPGEPGRYTASGANTDMIVGARDMFATHSLWFVTYSCGFATCSPRSIPYSQHPRLPRGGRHRINDETCWFTTGQHDTMRVRVSTIDTRKTRYNNTMHTERRSPCVLKWRVTCRRPVIVDVMLLNHYDTTNRRIDV